jgi:hypothetical protein
MATSNVTMFPPVNWQAQCATLERLLLEWEGVTAQQDDERLAALAAAGAKIAEFEQSAGLLQSQNQELISQQAAAAVSHQAELAAAKSKIGTMETVLTEAAANQRTIHRLRRWRNSLLFLIPITAVATLHYHTTIQAILPSWWPF